MNWQNVYQTFKSTNSLENAQREDALITYFVNKYERIWRFCVGPYVNVKPDKQRFMYLANLREEILEAQKRVVTTINTCFALEELNKATQRDYPIFTIDENKGMKEWVQRFLHFPESVMHEEDLHEISGMRIIYVEKEPLFNYFKTNHRFEHKPGREITQINNLLIYYKLQKSSPYWTTFNNKLNLRGSEFWIFGVEKGIMKSQPYSQNALKFIMRRVKA